MDKFKSSLSKDALSHVEIGPVIIDKKIGNVKKKLRQQQWRKKVKFQSNKYELLTKPVDKINYLSFSLLEEHRPHELHKEIRSMQMLKRR